MDGGGGGRTKGIGGGRESQVERSKTWDNVKKICYRHLKILIINAPSKNIYQFTLPQATTSVGVFPSSLTSSKCYCSFKIVSP